VQSYTRHQLKQDKFATFVSKEMQLATENRRSIITAVAVILGVLLLVVGYVTYTNSRDDKASLALGNAMRTYSAELRGPGAAATQDVSFASAKERAQAALKQFNQIASDYAATRNGKYARYMAGVAAMEAGDPKASEQYLTEAAGFRDKDIASLAKFALASLYRNQQRDADVIRLYKELIDADSTAVPKTTAQFELASFYETKQQPAEAARIYQQIQSEEQAASKAAAAKTAGQSKLAAAGAAPKSAVEELAANKLAQLKQADTKK
jgi:tetratricopeptide (TPR) repeat protein